MISVFSSNSADLRNQVNNWLVADSPHAEGCRFFELVPGIKHQKVLLRILLRGRKHHNHLLKTILRNHFGLIQPKETSLIKNEKKAKELVSTPENRHSFRDEWPFLSDPDCPPELKILAADKITAYNNMRAAHKRLFHSASDADQFAAVHDLVSNYIENYRIYNELKCYKVTGKILGKHSIWVEMQRLKSIRQSSPVELPLMAKKLQHNIWRIKSEIAKGDKPHLRPEREKKIREKQRELQEIGRLIASYK
jgi:hypothetical protein